MCYFSEFSNKVRMAAVVSQLSSLGSRLLPCQASHSTASMLLHRLTAPLLCAVTLAITAVQVFGDPIRCLPDSGDPKFVEEICWAMSTTLNRGGGQNGKSKEAPIN